MLMLMPNPHSGVTPRRTRFLRRPPGAAGQREAFLTDVVTVMERVVVGQSRNSQVPLGPQAVQLVPDDVLPLGQGEESLHVACGVDTHGWLNPCVPGGSARDSNCGYPNL